MRPRAPCRHYAHFRGTSVSSQRVRLRRLRSLTRSNTTVIVERVLCRFRRRRSRFGSCSGGILVSQLSPAVWGGDHPVWRTRGRKTSSSAANGIASCAAGTAGSACCIDSRRPISIAQHSEPLTPQPSRNAPAPQPLPAPPQAKSEPLVPDTVWRDAVGSSRPKAPTAKGSSLTSETPPPVSLPTTIVASRSYLVPSNSAQLRHSHRRASPMSTRWFPEKKTPSLHRKCISRWVNSRISPPANEVKDKLATLGFQTLVTQKGRFWGNSYYVLVGPYDNDREAKAARKSLTSRGFKPRAFERGSRGFAFSYVLTLNGARIPVGDYSIRWESYSSLVVVEFVQNNEIVATVDGKWAKRDAPYDRGAYAFTSNGDGSRNLVWIQFTGMRQTLLFDKSS